MGDNNGLCFHERYIVAEYCRGPFYMGWWLYERDTNDGRKNSSNGEWGWLQATDTRCPQYAIYELCQEMGQVPPSPRRYRDDFAEWFAATFPNGLSVRACFCPNEEEGIENWDSYKLITVPATRPRQRRGVIRTIRGAARADRQEALWEQAETDDKTQGATSG